MESRSRHDVVSLRALASVIVLAAAVAAVSACSSDQLRAGAGADGAAGAGGADASGGDTIDRQPVSLPSDDVLTRLAKLLWNTTPDAALLAANSGKLATKGDVGALARQMLGDPRAHDGVGAFYRWWLTLDRVAMVTKDSKLFPQWTADVGADAARETEAFGVGVTLDLDGTFQTLMNGSFSYVNERLAPIYGLASVSGAGLQKTDLDAGTRAGFLTQPSVLAMNATATRTRPTARGRFIRDRLFCQQIGLDPPGTLGAPVTVPANATGRQALELTVANPICQSCHEATDPIGFAYEGLDAIGHARTTDNGSPVDTTGMIANGAGVPTAFKGAVDLAKIIAGIGDVQSCFAQQWLRYAVSRELQAADATAVKDLAAAFQSAGLNLRALIVSVTQSDPFLAP